jgi:hypothetical protein
VQDLHRVDYVLSSSTPHSLNLMNVKGAGTGAECAGLQPAVLRHD